MGYMGHDVAVFDGARFAFIGVADDVLLRVTLVFDDLPFEAGGRACAAHADKVGGFELVNHAVPIPGLYEGADHAVFFAAVVGIGSALDTRHLGMRRADRFAAHGSAGKLLCFRSRDVGKDLVVNSHRGSLVAAAQAGDVKNLDFFLAGGRKSAFQIGAKFA
jgi:hypothetical protein